MWTVTLLRYYTGYSGVWKTGILCPNRKKKKTFKKTFKKTLKDIFFLKGKDPSCLASERSKLATEQEI